MNFTKLSSQLLSKTISLTNKQLFIFFEVEMFDISEGGHVSGALDYGGGGGGGEGGWGREGGGGGGGGGQVVWEMKEERVLLCP